MAETSMYAFECLCGKHVETAERDYICSSCGCQIRLEWGQVECPEVTPSPMERSVEEAA
jgi:hypothetical protein